MFNKDCSSEQQITTVTEVLEDSIKIILSGYHLRDIKGDTLSEKQNNIKLKLETVAFLKYVMEFENLFLYNPSRVVSFADIEGAVKSYDIKELKIAVGFF